MSEGVKEGNSYRQILRSSGIIGGASVLNIVIGLLRTKVAAVLLGPAGVGLIGLFANLVATATVVAGLGFGNVGTRQIAQAKATDDRERVATARRALFWGTLALSVLGAGAFWLLRPVLADRVMGDSSLANELGWLALAVALSVASASQRALLNGMRRIGDIARVSVGAAVLSAVVGIWALWLWGRAGIVVYVIAAPLASFALGHWYVSRLPRTGGSRLRISKLVGEWKVLASLGFAFMVAALAATVGQLVVRMLVQDELGEAALGYFQAAWAISMTYIGFVLAAMGTDYYPRLSAVIHDHVRVNRLVNEQTEVALLLALPVLLAMLGLAPWVIQLLYTEQFAEAATVLRWQVLGDLLKVASWPLGFILVASGAGKTFIFTQWSAMGLFAALTAYLLPILGLEATGVAFLGMYAGLLPLNYWLAAHKTRFNYSSGALRLLGAGFLCGVGVLFAAWHSAALASILGVLAAGLFGIYGLARLAHMADLGGPVGKIAGSARGVLIKSGVWRE